MNFKAWTPTLSVAGIVVAGMVLLQPAAVRSALPSAVAASAPPAADPDSCSRLSELKLKDVTITVAASMAEGAAVPSSDLIPMFGPSASVGRGLPAFCRVAGHIRPEEGSDIGFEMWLPSADWDGRLNGVGIGGFAGGIDYLTLGLAVKGGQAGVATDTGHRGTMQESGWAKGHPARVTDYAWRAIHLSTVTAKQMIAVFYGRAPDKSYFVGCSGGGRQGLMTATRFPNDYDGILSGAPAASFPELSMAMVNAVQALLPAGAAMRPAQVKLLQGEVLKQCDGADGQADELVADPRQCRFDTAKLACDENGSSECFSPAQITALKRIYAGPRNSLGRILAETYLPSGSESGDPAAALGWEGYILGGNAKSGGQGLADGILGDLIQQPFTTSATFDWDKDPPRLRTAMRDIDASPDLSRFFARGGKLILWHGWADAAIPPEATLRYRAAMLRASGPHAASSSRLFMVPGVQHCIGGLGPDSFGQGGAPARGENPERSMVAALQAWVENRRSAPETITARRGHSGFMGMPERSPERQRLLCAWPKTSVLKHGADPDKAASYVCH